MGQGQSQYWVYLCVALSSACSVDKHRSYSTGKGGEAGDSGTSPKMSGGSSSAGAGGLVSAGGKGGASSEVEGGAGGVTRPPVQTGDAGSSSIEPVNGEPCKLKDESYECLEDAGKARRVCRSGYWEEGVDCGAKQNCDRRDGSCKDLVAECEYQTPGYRYCDDRSQSVTCGPDLVSTESASCAGKCVQGQCAPVSCGDGVKQSPEECDDGNVVDTDDCTSGCKNKACGDGLVQSGEACDDGNTTAGDGCASCKVENGYLCSGVPSVCTAKCGDEIVAGKEACDDGNTVNDDGCKNDCTINRFQVIQAPANTSFVVEDTNADGSVLVGRLDPVPQDPFHNHAFYWTQAAGTLVVPGIEYVYGIMVSGNGGVVVGNTTFQGWPFRWSPGGSVQHLWDEGAYEGGHISAISSDGTAMAGKHAIAFRWTSGAFSPLVVPTSVQDGWVDVFAIGADGGVVVGRGSIGGQTRSLRWVGTGMAEILPLPTGFISATPKAVNADGSIVYGGANVLGEDTVFKWTSAGGSTVLKSGAVTGSVLSCSNDGKIVFGEGPADTWIWNDSDQQLRYVKDILGGLGANVSDWVDIQAKAISDDGKVIVGDGTPPRASVRSAWIARYR